VGEGDESGWKEVRESRDGGERRRKRERRRRRNMRWLFFCVVLCDVLIERFCVVCVTASYVSGLLSYGE